MYKRLKFSWAHIIAFVAIIIFGYITYVGLTYRLDKGLVWPLFPTLGITAAVFIWFMIVQQLKGVDNNYSFKKCVWFERIMIIISPFIFYFCMIPFNHALNVAKQDDIIQKNFSQAIAASQKMFTDYKSYADSRIINYRTFLNRIKGNKELQPDVYNKIGFTGVNDTLMIETEVKTLSNQLLSNYDTLQSEANRWLKNANQKTSVWNVFFVGNINEIQSAMNDWQQNLHDFSSTILSTEQAVSINTVAPFDGNIKAGIDSLDKLRQIYTNKNDELSFLSVIYGIILYFMMLLPYLVQKRNGVSTYTFWGRRFIGERTPQDSSHSDSITISFSNILDDENNDRNNMGTSESDTQPGFYYEENDGEEDIIKPLNDIE